VFSPHPTREGALLINIGFMLLICRPKLKIDVAPCFVLRANRSLVGILHNNGLRHRAHACCYGKGAKPSTSKELPCFFPLIQNELYSGKNELTFVFSLPSSHTDNTKRYGNNTICFPLSQFYQCVRTDHIKLTTACTPRCPTLL
jgi:hypothetical protein